MNSVPLPDPRPARRKVGPLAGASLVLPLAWIVWDSAPAHADEPIALGNEQIGMTAEHIAEAEPSEAAPVQSEWRAGSTDVPSDAFATPAAASGPVVSTYSACIELAVQAGNPFSAASGVCQAIFPEDEAGGAPVSTSAIPRLDEAPADEPIVLKLHGSPPVASAPEASATDSALAGAAFDAPEPAAGEATDAAERAAGEATDAAKPDAGETTDPAKPDAGETTDPAETTDAAEATPGEAAPAPEVPPAAEG